ncbi:glycine cleavage system protein GcvH [Salinisphaera sp. USBA-960]|nr:glycine cleavage system protein GcvH [Salifodinibacter halophilus]NNC26455.1 glycine cleavage system protein GcvH [Salifodinibacter halophilus]
MGERPDNYRYTQSHEWVAPAEDGTARIGITDHAQSSLGDLVFVELPEVGTSFNAGEQVAVVESVKAASDIYAPVAGEIASVNETLEDAPEQVNEDPFGEGWLFELKLESEEATESLLDAAAYKEVADADD